MALVSVLGGCTADSSDDDFGVAEGATRIDPADDETLGVLLLSRAAGVTTPSPAEFGTFGSTRLAVGSPARMNAASGCLRYTSSSLSGSTEQCNVNVTKGATTEVKLAAVNVKYDTQSDAGRLHVDFGQAARLTVAQKQQAGDVVVADGNRILSAPNPTFDVSLLGGQYTFGFGPKILGERKVTLAPDSKTDIDLTPATELRSTIQIQWPNREFPNATHANYPQCAMNHAYLVQRDREIDINADGSPSMSGGDGVEQAIKFDAQTPSTLKVLPFTSTEAPHHYELVVNNIIVKIDAQPGQTVTIPVQRLDINDVRVTTESGEARLVKGTYQVFRQVSSNWRLVTLWDRRANCGNVANMLTTFSTGTGLDVPTGTYKVVISYTTAEGAKTQEHIVNVP